MTFNSKLKSYIVNDKVSHICKFHEYKILLIDLVFIFAKHNEPFHPIKFRTFYKSQVF